MIGYMNINVLPWSDLDLLDKLTTSLLACHKKLSLRVKRGIFCM